MNLRNEWIQRVAALIATVLLVAACGGAAPEQPQDGGDDGGDSAGGDTYTVSITVSGLDAPVHPDVFFAMLFSYNDAGDRRNGIIGANSNGVITFAETLANDRTYEVTFRDSSDDSMSCVIDNGSGTINGANVTNITATCVPSYTVSGQEIGATPKLQIFHNGVIVPDFLIRYTSGDKRFRTPGNKGFLPGDTYSVAVSPESGMVDTCKVRRGSGVMGNADVSNVEVNCSASSIAGTVTGLIGTGLRLSLSAELEIGPGMLQDVEMLDIAEDGEFEFEQLVPEGGEYRVAVEVQPSDPGQECLIENGEGIVEDDVTNIEVRCPQPLRMYRFDDAFTRHTGTPLSGGEKLEGVLDESFVFGPGPAVQLGEVSGLDTTELFQVQLDNDAADGIVFSNRSGYTYWLAAESRRDMFAPDPTYSSFASISSTQLATLWRYRKRSPAAAFRLELSQINMLGYHDTHLLANTNQLTASAFLQVAAHRRAAGGDFEVEPFYSAASDISLVGRNASNQSGPGASNAWNLESQVLATADYPIWSQDDFVLNPNAGIGLADVALARLAASKFIDIDVSSLSVGEEFVIVSSAIVTVDNFYTPEGGSVVYLRDPAAFDPGVDQGGITIETEGLVLLDAGDIDLNSVRLTSSLPAPACDATGTEQSVLEFSAAAYRVYEGEAFLDAVNVTRGGNDSGLVSASVILTGDTATVDTDFEAGDLLVRFGDGSTEPRTLALPIIADDLNEGDENLTLTLASPGGCAVIGARNTATVTIVDDDAPPPSPNFYTVGGTVSGLAGSGLQLSNIGSDNLAVTANGPFSFPRETPDGISYEVRVATQPVNPGQSCAVTNGSGRMAGADVGNVEVECTTLPPNAAGLDPDFGSDGKLTVPGFDAATDIALQSDGKIVAVGGDTISRYTTDGELDTGFGAGGSVIVNVFDSSDAYDALQAVAVQPDGQIIVAGSSRDGANAKTDVIVVRYDTNGVLDPTFGNGSSVITDGVDAANDVLIQPDGAIVIAGHAPGEDATGISGADFAAVRYTSGGALDTNFGNGGIATTNIAGRSDIAYAVALQIDGKLVLTGRVANTGGDDPDIGLVRYDINGLLDPTFGTDGIVRMMTPDWDEASDVVVQADGSIVVAGFSIVGASTMLTVARFDTAGTLDAGFGTDGILLDPVMERGNSLALQADGQTIVVGTVGEFPWDLAIVRLNAIGALDTSFGQSGLMRFDFFGGSDGANAVVIQPDGKIVIGGYAVNGTQTALSLIRVMP